MDNLKVSVIRQNTQEYSTPQIKSIPVAGAQVQGTFWRVPVQNAAGLVIRHDYKRAVTKPTNDSVKVIRIQDNSNNIYMLLIADSADESAWTTRANECCDGQTAWAAVSIPDPIVEEKGCLNSGNYVYTVYVDDAAAGETILAKLSFDGVLQTAAPAEGFATAAAFKTWADANWNASGTWAITDLGTFTKVTFTTSTKGSVGLSLYKRNYFDSNATAASEQIDVTADGVVYAPVTVATAAGNAALAAAANANLALSVLGTFVSITGNKIRLVSDTVKTAAIVITSLA